MHESIRMGVRTHSHAATAIGAHLAPVGETGLGVDLPAQHPVFLDSITPGNGPAGTHDGALLAGLAERDHGAVERSGVRYQGQLRGYH